MRKHGISFAAAGILLAVLLAFPACSEKVPTATEDVGTEGVTMNKAITSIINNQLSREEQSALRNTRKYDDSMKGKRITDQTVLRTYLLLPWNHVDKSISEMISAEEAYFDQYASAGFTSRYLVLDQTPYFVDMGRGTKTVSVPEKLSADVPKYAKDILPLLLIRHKRNRPAEQTEEQKTDE